MTSFRTHLRILWGHRIYLIIYLVLLSCMGVLIGLTYGGSPDTTVYEQDPARVAVIDRDGSELSRSLGEHVLADRDVQLVADERRAIQDAVARDTCAYILVIPEGWGEALMEAASQGEEAPRLETYVSYQSGTGTLVDVATTSYASSLYGFATTLGGNQADVAARAHDAFLDTTRMSMVPQASRPLPGSFDITCKFSTYPIFAVTTVYIAILMSKVNARPVRDRRLSSPTTGRRRSWGLLATCLIIGLVSWAWIFGLNVTLFARDALASSGVQLALVGAALLAYALAAVAVGFLLGQLGVGENAANAAANILSMLMSFLGGAWTGLDLLPPSILTVAHFTPAYWCTLTLEQAISLESTDMGRVAPLLGNIGIELLFGVAIALVALALGRSRARAEL